MSYLLIPLVFLQFELLASSYVPSAKQCGRPYQSPIISTSRIVGGYPARKHSWPWIVSIRQASAYQPLTDPGIAVCAGSLIHEKYVLTAAHCVYHINYLFLSDYFVVVGAHYINDTNPIRLNIKSIILHDKYDDDLFSYDIALLELSPRVDLNSTTVGLICLPSTKSSTYPYEQLDSIVIGWGRLQENSSMSYTLQQVRLPIVSNKNPVCSKQIGDNLVHFCAGFIQGGKDACQGDSGGPLMIYEPKTNAWSIAGITSYGYGCARAEKPGVYTRVSVFIDWINKQINSSSESRRMSLSTKIILFVSCIILFFWTK